MPILMYHHVGDLPPEPDSIRMDLTVPAEVFQSEMQYLADHGFHTIHLSDLVSSLRTAAPLPSKPVVLTFDDGYDDNYVNAYPALKARGLSATFFIITGRADQSAAGYMTWGQIEELAANGMEIGNHTVDHLYNLGSISGSRQTGEIQPAQASLLAHFPNAPRVFSYPSGSYNATTVGILRQLGYTAAVTTTYGVVQSSAWPLELRRARIRGSWSLSTFAYWVESWSGG